MVYGQFSRRYHQHGSGGPCGLGLASAPLPAHWQAGIEMEQRVCNGHPIFYRHSEGRGVFKKPVDFLGASVRAALTEDRRLLQKRTGTARQNVCNECFYAECVMSHACRGHGVQQA